MAFTLTGSSINATAGFQFNLTCETSIKYLTLQKDSNILCTIIGGYPNGTCELTGSSNANYTYSCTPASNTYKVIIPGSLVTESLHKSQWSCGDPFGSGSAQYVLHVNVPVSSVTISSKPTDTNTVNVIRGRGQTFSCTTNAGRPPARIQWYLSTINLTASATPQPDVCYTDCKNDTVISSSQLTYVGNLNDDGQTMYCTAVNTIAGGVRSADKTIVIVYGPTQIKITPSNTTYIIKEDGSIIPITCTSDCKPNCTLTWTGPNILAGTTSILNLQNIDRNQSGNYQCTAINEVSSITSNNVSIIVKYGPRFANISSSTESYTVKEKQNIGPITCTADCNPNCTMTWTGPNLSTGTTSILNLENIDRNQSGNYQCTAINEISNVTSAIISIIVNYGPGQINITPPNTSYLLTENGSIGPITCTANCKPNCSLSWTGPNLPAGTASILSLQNIDRNQSGNYQCTATNNVSSMTSNKFSIIVKYGPRFAKISPSTDSYIIKEKQLIGPIACTADCNPNCTTTWTGPNLPTGTTSILNLQNIDRNQSGNYQCTALNEISNVTSVIVSIIVNYGPRQIDITPPNTSYLLTEKGSIGPISCTANCNPNCSLSWTGPNLPAVTASILSLQNIDRNQSGNYQCTAINNVSSMTSNIVSIIVKYGPRFANISPSTESYTIKEKQNFGPIACTADCIPNCTTIWTGPNLPTGATSILNLQNIDRNQSGNYQCTAINEISSMTSVIVSIIVNYGPRQINISPPNTSYILTEKGSIGPITCTANCKPNCTLIWTGPNLPAGTTSILNLLKIDRNQSGNYQCTAANDISSMASNNVSLIVKYGPRLAFIFPSTESYTVVEGESIGNITCTADCNPNCTTTWTGPNLLTSTTSILNLQNIDRNQSGNYQCTAINEISSVTSVIVSIIVNYGPRFVEIKPSTSLYTKNESLESIGPITCKADCQPACNVTWNGPGIAYGIKDVLNFTQITRNQSGNYSCTATNYIGNYTTIILGLFVNYIPKILEIGENQTLTENTTVVVTCKVDSNPLPNIMWMFENTALNNDETYNLSYKLQETYLVSTLTIHRIRCTSMGMYRCITNNMLGATNRSLYISVICSPRVQCLECLSPVVPIKNEAVLNITVPIIGFPKPTMFWRFLENGSSVNVSGETINYDNINKHTTTYLKRNVTEKDFGFYQVFAYSGVRNTSDFLYSFEVISQRKPNSPENVTCAGKINSVALSWKSEFNGGPDQHFTVYYKIISPVWESGDWMAFKTYSDPGQHKYISDEIQPLQFGASYVFKVHAVNVYNYSSSNHAFCNTSANDADTQSVSSALTGGLAGLGSAIFILVIVGAVGYLMMSRRSRKKGKDTELINSANTDADSYNDALRDNPMYVSSGPNGDDTQKVEYSVVNTKFAPKQLQDTNDARETYAVSQKSKSEIKSKYIEMGSIYENSEDIIAARRSTIYPSTDTNRKQKDQPNKNKDGLVYADLDLTTVTDGKRFIIRGLENRNLYADIDLSKKADPLPDTDSDEEQNPEVKPANNED